MLHPGSGNLITDVPGLSVGHATDEAAMTGVTALLCEAAWHAGVDVRGGGPGVRETETLAPENLVGRAHAIVLAGGSVFGLAAADGAASLLSSRGVGLHLQQDSPAIPIIPCAVLHDLANAGDKRWGTSPPYRNLGIRAVDNAGANFALGSVGAGRGAMAGLIKGGLGSSSLSLGDGIMVGALAAVNSVRRPEWT
jgi:L-aminopeptidase/D-esterase-like protein